MRKIKSFLILLSIFLFVGLPTLFSIVWPFWTMLGLMGIEVISIKSMTILWDITLYSVLAGALGVATLNSNEKTNKSNPVIDKLFECVIAFNMGILLLSGYAMRQFLWESFIFDGYQEYLAMSFGIAGLVLIMASIIGMLRTFWYYRKHR